MKLHNVIIVWDVYAVTDNGDPEEARAAVMEIIRRGELEPSESIAPEVGVSGVREAWKSQGPIVAASVSDADFAKLKGKTSQDVYEMLTTKKSGDAKK